MGKVTIDDIAIEVPDGTNLMEAARKAGVEIPHFCYHPGLSVVAQCRMCLVDITGIPKVQPACNSFAKDGMIVNTQNEKVKEAQRAVMEFLLINHPLDCPICDQAGECKLQDNSFGYGQGGSRYTISKRQYPGFDRTAIGPHVVADMTRCIQCTRCIRFCQEISETGELSFQERGGRTLVWTHEGRPLDNEMSACAADVCPVGALTVKEFRFRARVWYLEKANSICAGCDVGCNVTVESKDKIAYRFLPRQNFSVNDHWMCDYGRFLVEDFNRRDVKAPRRRATRDGDPAGSFETISFDAAIDAAAASLLAAKESKKRIVIVAPASLPTEALWLAKKLAVEALGSAEIVTFIPKGEKPHRVKNQKTWAEGIEGVPNGAGARLLGLAESTNLLPEKGGNPEVVLVVDGDLASLSQDPNLVKNLRKARTLIVLARLDSQLTAAADLVFPLAPHTESEGTFVNGRRRLQRFDRAFLPLDGNRPAWELLSRIGRLFGEGFSFVTAAAVFEAMSAAVPSLGGITFPSIGSEGISLEPKTAGAAPDPKPAPEEKKN